MYGAMKLLSVCQELRIPWKLMLDLKRGGR